MIKNTLIFRPTANITFSIALSLFSVINLSSVRAMDLVQDTEKVYQKPINHHVVTVPDELLGEVEIQEYTAYMTQSIKVDSIFKDFIIPEGMHILDVGCSDGKVTKELSLLTKAAKVVGIDPALCSPR